MKLLTIKREGPLPYRSEGVLYQSGWPWKFEGRGAASGIQGFSTTFEGALTMAERMIRRRLTSDEVA